MSLIDRDLLLDNLLDQIDSLKERLDRIERYSRSGDILPDMILGLFDFSGTEIAVSGGVCQKSASKIVWNKLSAFGVTYDVDTIEGGAEGDILFLSALSDSSTAVLKDGTGNLLLSGDLSLNNSQDLAMLVYIGGYWREVSFTDIGA